jgi:spermidine/putrescine-binding protein
MRGLRLSVILPLAIAVVVGTIWGLWIRRNQELKSAASDATAEIHVLSYRGLLSSTLLKRFESETSIRVVLTEAETPEALWEKLESATPQSFDLVTLFSYQIPLAASLTRLQPLPLSKLKNLQSISPDFREIPVDRSFEAVVPVLWGISGLLTDTRKISQPPETIQSALNGKSKLGLPNSTMELARLIGEGKDLKKSLNSLLESIVLAEDYLSPTSLLRTANPPSFLMISHGESAFGTASEAHFKFQIPQEGGLFWTLSFALHQNARFESEALRVLDFLLETDSSLDIVQSYRQATTNRTLEATDIDARLKPSYLRQIPLNRVIVWKDFSRAREIRALLDPKKN